MRSLVPWLIAALAAGCSAGRGPDARRDSVPAAPDTGAAAAGDAAVTPLEGTDWTVIEVKGVPVAAADSARRPGLRLMADGHKVQGSAGCNRMMGSYELRGSSLKFGPLATTRMACPSMDAEQAYLVALGATTRYEIAGTTLTLFGPDGPVVRLELASAPPS